jgi:hypothetical protein
MSIIFLTLLTHFLTYAVFPEHLIAHDFSVYIRTHKANTIQKVTHDTMVTKYLLEHKKADITDTSDAVSKRGLTYMMGSFHKSYTELYVKLDQQHSNFLVPKFKIVKVYLVPLWN